MTKHSKRIIAMLLTAICLMGILPLSIAALAPNPAPYFGANYVFSSIYGDEAWLIYHGNITGDSMPTGYFDSKCYTYDIQIDAINALTDESVKILFTTTSSRKPITWLYSAHWKGDVYIDALLGATSRVVIADGNNYNFSYVLVNRAFADDGTVVIMLAMSRTMVHNTSGDGVSLDIDEWTEAGAVPYLVYLNDPYAGEAIGTDVDINVLYENGYQLTHVFDRSSTTLSPNLVLESSQIPDIVIDKYSYLANSILDSIASIWGATSWLSVVPIIVFGGAINLILTIIIKKILEGR